MEMKTNYGVFKSIILEKYVHTSTWPDQDEMVSIHQSV